MFWSFVFDTKIQKPNSLFSKLLSFKILKNSLIKQIFLTEATSVSLFSGEIDVSKSIKNPYQKHQTETTFTLVM